MDNRVEGTENFRQLFLKDTPFLDVRAQVEFDKGTFPTAYNAPILTTEERHQVGHCYKNKGQDKAIELGHSLVSGQIKQQRIERWCQYIQSNPKAHLYCWRGGLRSHLTHQWLLAEGIHIPLISGGYKSLRRVLLDEIESAARQPLIIIGGKTGSAKTALLNDLKTGIDLEAWANHRGSSFGRRIKEPPCQSNFENNLAIDVLKQRYNYPQKVLFFEDESRRVGACSIPLVLWKSMLEAPVVVLDLPLVDRVERIVQEYVIDMLAEHRAAFGEKGNETYQEYLMSSLFRIRKRLGLQRHKELAAIMHSAIEQQIHHGKVSAHNEWIETLLVDYYDPMYDYQLKEKQQRITFRGDYQTVLEWAKDYS